MSRTAGASYSHFLRASLTDTNLETFLNLVLTQKNRFPAFQFPKLFSLKNHQYVHTKYAQTRLGQALLQLDLTLQDLPCHNGLRSSLQKYSILMHIRFPQFSPNSTIESITMYVSISKHALPETILSHFRPLVATLAWCVQVCVAHTFVHPQRPLS